MAEIDVHTLLDAATSRSAPPELRVGQGKKMRESAGLSATANESGRAGNGKGRAG